MASILDMSASSDSEDDEYVPPINGAASDSSCDEELGSDDEGFKNSGELVKATKKQEEADVKGVESDSTAKVDEKKRAKELWDSFLSDVEPITPKKSNTAVCSSNTTNLIASKSGTKAPKIDTKKSASKVFEFAGETITHTVDKDLCDKKTPSYSEKNLQPDNPTEKPPCMPIKRGIDSILGGISNKNKKLTVLEKTKMDWVSFKKDEGLDNELEKFNKGRQGFLERTRFLERADLRSFEIEKSMRQTLRKK